MWLCASVLLALKNRGAGPDVSQIISCNLFVFWQILQSKSGEVILRGSGSQDLSGHNEGARDYDSGNDTSSPPSSKTGVSRSCAVEYKRDHCQRVTSPEKLRFADRDSASDSGNSVTSYASSCKPYREVGFSTTLFSKR